MSLPTPLRVHVLVEVRVDLDRAGVQPGLVRERADARRTAGATRAGSWSPRRPRARSGSASRSRPSGSTGRPSLSSRLATTETRSALPVRSPYPLRVPCTWVAPASTAASVLATAQPVSLWQWMPTRTPVVASTSSHDVADPARAACRRWCRRARPPRRPRRTPSAAPRARSRGWRGSRRRSARRRGTPAAPRRAGARRCRGPSRGSPRAWCAARARRAGRATSRPASPPRRRCRAARRPAGRRRPRRRPAGWRRRPRACACRRSSSSRGAAEELGVLGVGARPAALDVADAEPVELARDRQLVGDGEVQPLLLRAVAQRRVVDVEGLRRSAGWCSSR